MLREIDFLLKICWLTQTLVWRQVTWTQKYASLNHGKRWKQSPFGWFLESLQQTKRFWLFSFLYNIKFFICF